MLLSIERIKSEVIVNDENCYIFSDIFASMGLPVYLMEVNYPSLEVGDENA